MLRQESNKERPRETSSGRSLNLSSSNIKYNAMHLFICVFVYEVTTAYWNASWGHTFNSVLNAKSEIQSTGGGVVAGPQDLSGVLVSI